MHPKVKKDVKAILDKAFDAIKNNQFYNLIGLSDQIIHSMSIYQERETADCAVVVYALSKFFGKEKFLNHDDRRKFEEIILADLNFASKSLANNNMKAYRQAISNILKRIEKFDKSLRLFEQPVLDYARLQKASKLAEHGLSAGRAAEFMGVPAWELAGFLGNTRASEMHPSAPSTNSSRVKYVFELFGVKQ